MKKGDVVKAKEDESVRESMKPLHKVRLKNLQNLVKVRFKGNATACATAIGRSHTFLWQLINGYRGIGEASARHIEECLELKVNALDAADVMVADRKLLAQMGNGATTSYWMVPRVEWNDLTRKKKQSTTEVMPCPVECSEATVFVTIQTASMEPKFLKGEKVFADEKQKVLVDGQCYLVMPKKRGAVGTIRQAMKLDAGGFLFVTIDQRMKEDNFRQRDVTVFGRVIGCWHDA
jgi:DNA-binding transcriptional regulator YdaS (Cro superfamily)